MDEDWNVRSSFDRISLFSAVVSWVEQMGGGGGGEVGSRFGKGLWHIIHWEGGGVKEKAHTHTQSQKNKEDLLRNVVGSMQFPYKDGVNEERWERRSFSTLTCVFRHLDHASHQQKNDFKVKKDQEMNELTTHLVINATI